VGNKLAGFLLITFIMSFQTAHAVVTQNGNLILAGTIADNVSIAVTPAGNYNNLNLSSTAVDSVVASVAESSNSSAGYVILAHSTNAGKLVHSTDNSQSVSYTMKYGTSAALTLSAVDQTIKTQSTGGVYSAVASAVSISYAGVSASTKRAGSYTDTITFTIQSQ
jgi:hypothetical protein